MNLDTGQPAPALANERGRAEPVRRPKGGDDRFSATVEAVTSAFGDRTRREIFLYVRDHPDGSTASQVAESFSLHPNVARHHLEKLAAGGYLTVSLEKPGPPLPAGYERQPSGAGRPSKIYRPALGENLLDLPSRQDDLLITLLVRTLALVDPEDAERVAEEVGEEYGRTLAAAMAPEESQRSLRSSLAAIAEALTAHGFAAHAEARGAGLAVISDHCPFGSVAPAHPVVCAVDRGIVRGMLVTLHGRGVEMTTSSRARGDDSCVTLI